MNRCHTNIGATPENTNHRENSHLPGNIGVSFLPTAKIAAKPPLNLAPDDLRSNHL